MKGERWECEARRVSDQMNCGRCGYVWDMNDDDPPKCMTKQEIDARKMAKLREGLDLPSRVP